LQTVRGKLWQHFCGVEIETEKDFFDEKYLINGF
jgi:hypothetical protein